MCLKTTFERSNVEQMPSLIILITRGIRAFQTLWYTSFHKILPSPNYIFCNSVLKNSRILITLLLMVKFSYSNQVTTSLFQNNIRSSLINRTKQMKNSNLEPNSHQENMKTARNFLHWLQIDLQVSRSGYTFGWSLQAPQLNSYRMYRDILTTHQLDEFLAS